jgi:GntR family transcriptional regulator
VVTQLLNAGLLEVLPGTGTIVAEAPAPNASQRARLLDHDVEQLVVEAKKLGIGLRELSAAVDHHWERLDAPEEAVRRKR